MLRSTHKRGKLVTAKHRITVNLEDHEYEALQRIAEGSDRSLAWLGRRAICDLIERRDRETAPLFAILPESASSARRAAS